jgi:endonuclease-3
MQLSDAGKQAFSAVRRGFEQADDFVGLLNGALPTIDRMHTLQKVGTGRETLFHHGSGDTVCSRLVGGRDVHQEEIPGVGEYVGGIAHPLFISQLSGKYKQVSRRSWSSRKIANTNNFSPNALRLQLDFFVMENRTGKQSARKKSDDARERASRMADVLAGLYPDALPHLAHRTPWELLVAVMLSAQCTDAMVNKVTPALFARFPDAARTAEASLEELENLVRSTGFFHTKAKHVLETARIVLERFKGSVPDTMPGLLTLPGVARKTAAVVLWGAFNKNEGLAVDTHVGRIAFRLGFTQSKVQGRIEQDLMALFPRGQWGLVNHRMVSFGRGVCKAQRPLCRECPAATFCPRTGVDEPTRVASSPAKEKGAPCRRLKKTAEPRKNEVKPPAEFPRGRSGGKNA